MPSLFENVGRNKNNVDQDDHVDTYNPLREFFRRAENEDAATLLDIKDAY